MTYATNARTMVGTRAFVKSIQKIWSVFPRRPIWLWLDHAFWHRDFLIGPSNHGGPWLLLRSEVRPTTTKFLHILIIVRWVGAAFDGRHGSAIASGWDWELLRRIAGRLCPSVSAPTKSARPTNNGNRRRPRKQRRGRRHSSAWFFLFRTSGLSGNHCGVEQLKYNNEIHLGSKTDFQLHLNVKSWSKI